MVSSIGFRWLLAILGLLNLLFTPWLVLLRELPTPLHPDQVTVQSDIHLSTQTR